jgi:hypothetical protein
MYSLKLNFEINVNFIIGSIGIEELEKPLISLGLCKTRAEVQ